VQQQTRGVINIYQTGVVHGENANFIGRTIPVLGRPEHPETLIIVTFKVKDGVHHVLKDAGTG
jgi:hypothetical protein